MLPKLTGLDNRTRPLISSNRFILQSFASGYTLLFGMVDQKVTRCGGFFSPLFSAVDGEYREGDVTITTLNIVYEPCIGSIGVPCA